ncbi:MULTISPECIES: DUF418 domain-containing protein [Pseudonocardia]|uniref:DUF418 domain-containing protein n=2 Tax=Pseudonocardia TaxID=1847 RepID=A0A1Y2MUS4_PSEAH|nr:MULTISPECIES: DUF418 domain-containing protein [Pseudonocardia]OSY38935.1 hypothetical protein BG845_03807 [Pseudonocardia autotrophica]TDN76191.1 putative membrane protein YeiB [Pseudonocardia autotrophica]BBG00172.1 hypothetical protein Pdca_13810 [Pseudonocardia autotrophica]GEC26759.1 hypothetical protein PSA01_37880 [Pseudonocardia saturnea]
MPTAPTLRERALAPDLARGLMLALIALAHSQLLTGRVLAPLPGTASVVDTAAQAALTLLVDSRAYPMFAALFGYGLVQILRTREDRLGPDGARRVLRRRGWWLVAFGVAHTVLLFTGDILASYGLLALLLAGMLRATGRRLLILATIAATMGALTYGTVLALPDPTGGAELPTDPLASALLRLTVLPVLTPLNALMAAGPFLIGIWAARRRLLEDPAAHHLLLRRTAVTGIALGLLGALPQAARTTGFWAPDTVAAVAAGTLHTLTGYAGGLGYAAAIGLLAAHLAGRRRTAVTGALVACGRRSMSCYLAQSVAWLLLFEPYLFDLGGTVGPAGAAAIGLGVWGITVGVAALAARADRPGPAEALLRRLVEPAAR